MLYDPKWEKQTKADPHSLASLIAWLEQQQPEEIYCFQSSGRCLLAQYFTENGMDKIIVGTSFYAHGSPLHPTDLPAHFNDIARLHPHTFGAALERARSTAAR